MTRISDRFLQLAVLFALSGMVLGVIMGKSEIFTLSPVHAHINLVGWVSMALFGLFYRVFPESAVGKLATVHFGLYVLGALIMMPSLACYLLGTKAASIPLAIASVMVLVAMILFAIIVFKATSAKRATA
jgi:hypothetical protein